MNQAKLGLKVLQRAKEDTEWKKYPDLLPKLSPGGKDIVMAKFSVVGTFIFDLLLRKIYRTYKSFPEEPVVALEIPNPLAPIREYASEEKALKGYLLGMDWTDGRDKRLVPNLSAEAVDSLLQRIRRQGVEPLDYILRS
jgi:hypothetical protein